MCFSLNHVHTLKVCETKKQVTHAVVTRGSPQHPPSLLVHRQDLSLHLPTNKQLMHVTVCSVPAASPALARVT